MTDIKEITRPVKRPRRMARKLKPAGAQEAATDAADGNQAKTPSKPNSKASLVLQLLVRPEGATVAHLVAATNWLPHTTRAALTGLKKKGHDVTSSKVDGEERVYRVVAGAYRLQEQKFGGVKRSTKSLLRQVAMRASNGDDSNAMPRKLTPGTRLVRDWHGVGHTVTVLDDGFEYDGKKWKSLTAIARAITGTHWNGPRFFGLTGNRS